MGCKLTLFWGDGAGVRLLYFNDNVINVEFEEEVGSRWLSWILWLS